MEGPKLKAPSPSGHSSSILIASPIRAPLPTAEGEISMTMEVRELLSQAGLDTSGHMSGNSTPKRLQPMVLVTPLPTKLEDFPWPVDTSSQVSTPDDAEMEDASLRKSPLPPPLQPRHQGLVVTPLPWMQPISGKRPTRPWENC